MEMLGISHVISQVIATRGFGRSSILTCAYVQADFGNVKLVGLQLGTEVLYQWVLYVGPVQFQ